ncbi:hypothetical protein FQR65_LT13366 [Abscondita terminalis]|nr:hypothetical protein FQR65_LT13366 [Abscondita terminalis]
MRFSHIVLWYSDNNFRVINMDSNNYESNGFKKNLKIHTLIRSIPARLVLYLLTTYSMAVLYMNRVPLNLSILAMVKENVNDEHFNLTEKCYVNGNSSYMTPVDYGGTLEWSLNEQYYVLTSFYWTYITAQVFCGRIVQTFGTKQIFGLSLVVASICNLCVPISSGIHYIIVVILQSIQGFAQGFTWAAIYAAVSVWIPLDETSRFITCTQGYVLGMVLANIIFGFIISKFGWVYVFYFAGTLGLFSSILWYFLMHDQPEQHPRISKKELQLIQENRDQNLRFSKIAPWFSIITSLPVWAIAINSFGRMWMLSIVIIYGPLYFKNVLNLTVEMNGLVAGISALVTFLSSLLFSYISDKIITHKLLSVAYNRKIFSLVGHIAVGIMAVALGHIQCNIPLNITIWFFIQSFMVLNFVGSMTNIVDISPNYSGPVCSFVQFILLLPTIFSTFAIKTFLQYENISKAWRHFFYLSSGITFGTAIFYIIFASGEVQQWDVAECSTKLKDKKSSIKDDEVNIQLLK